MNEPSMLVSVYFMKTSACTTAAVPLSRTMKPATLQKKKQKKQKSSGINVVGSKVQLIEKTSVQHFLSFSDQWLDLSGRKTQVGMLLVGGVDG